MEHMCSSFLLPHLQLSLNCLMVNTANLTACYNCITDWDGEPCQVGWSSHLEFEYWTISEINSRCCECRRMLRQRVTSNSVCTVHSITYTYATQNISLIQSSNLFQIRHIFCKYSNLNQHHKILLILIKQNEKYIAPTLALALCCKGI